MGAMLLEWLLWIITAGIVVYLFFWILNWLSYQYIKNRVLHRQRWDLNICCGKTDGGGVNADIVKHADVPNFVFVPDIYDLPFEDNQFEHVLCSHTIEHVDDLQRLQKELQRVGKEVTYLLPPLWDISAAFNLIEHKWIFFSLRSEHRTLPPYKRLPLADTIQKWLGQKVKA